MNRLAHMATDLQVQARDISNDLMCLYNNTAINLQPKWLRTSKFRRATSLMT